MSDSYESGRHFLDKMDSGELDQNLGTEIKKLSPEQLAEVVQVLMEREAPQKESET